jgi:hypothetical protein
MDMRRIRIAIDPHLKADYGPEICWAWRLLLTGIGVSWNEVPFDTPASEIAFGMEHSRAPKCRLFVPADPKRWNHRADLRLAAVGHQDGASYPVYEDESRGSKLFCIEEGCVRCERDIILDVFCLVTGQEEHFWPYNKHGHYELSTTPLHRELALRLALSSSLGWWLERTFQTLGFPPPTPRWPHGKRAAACLSHDVDYPEVIRWVEPMRILRRQGLGGLPAIESVISGARTHWHFSSWVRLEQQFNARSAFFFAARKGSLREFVLGKPDPFYDIQSDRFAPVFRQLSAEGFEVGLHSSYCAFDNVYVFATEKARLERASGQEVHGNRHHYLHLKPGAPESTLLMHERIGFRYDASLYHDRYVGWRRGLTWPYFPFHQVLRRELRTLQISTAWMDDQLFGFQSENPGDRMDILKNLAATAYEQGGCICVDVHDYVYDDVLFPGWRMAYTDLLEHLATCSDFWIATPMEVTEYWINRGRAIRRESDGLNGLDIPCLELSTSAGNAH